MRSNLSNWTHSVWRKMRAIWVVLTIFVWRTVLNSSVSVCLAARFVPKKPKSSSTHILTDETSSKALLVDIKFPTIVAWNIIMALMFLREAIMCFVITKPQVFWRDLIAFNLEAGTDILCYIVRVRENETGTNNLICLIDPLSNCVIFLRMNVSIKLSSC